MKIETRRQRRIIAFNQLHFQAAVPAFATFVLRTLPRLLPAKWLGKVYAKLRT